MLTTIALLLGCLTLTTWARPEVKTNEDRPCFKYDVNGCTIPFDLPFFYKEQFTPACDRHDVCYLCGVGYDFTRYECDLAFRYDTLETCKADFLSRDSNDQTELVLKATKELGFDGVQGLLSEKMPKLTNALPYPGLIEFDNWLASHDNKIKILAEWVMKVSEKTRHLNEGSDVVESDQQKIEAIISKLNLSPEDLTFRTESSLRVSSEIVEILCAEVLDYLAAQGEIPIVADKPLTCGNAEYVICDFFSEVYFLATAIFGLYGWSTEPEYYCNEAWVPGCLPPQ